MQTKRSIRRAGEVGALALALITVHWVAAPLQPRPNPAPAPEAETPPIPSTAAPANSTVNQIPSPNRGVPDPTQPPVPVDREEFPNQPAATVVSAAALSHLGLENLPLSQDVLWRRPATEPSLAAFQRWADAYVALPAAERPAAEAEGRQLALARRSDLATLIEKDPARALERAVPETLRRQLPAAVVAQLEERVDGRGDLLVTGATPGENGAAQVSEARATTTRAVVNGQTYKASVYGRRDLQPTRWRVPLHGIALNGRMAVSEWPARVLEPIETQPIVAAKSRTQEPLCSASGATVTSAGTPVALQVGSDYELYCRPSHAAQQLGGATTREVLLPPGFGVDGSKAIIAASGGNGVTVPNPSAQGDASWTKGDKRIVMVRLNFNGQNYHNLSAANCSDIVDQMSETYQRWSYGQHSLKPVGQGSWVSPILDLPHSASYYDGDEIDNIWSVVKLWLVAQGWNPWNYDYVMCLAGPAPIVDPDDYTKTVWWGGLGQIGDKFTFLRTGGDTTDDRIARAARVGLHEVGHNLGLRHTSNKWTTPQPDGEILGVTIYKTGAEYGDRFDRMGSGPDDFNVRYKQWLRWLTDDEVPLGLTDGVYYLNEHDMAENGGVRGLQVPFTIPIGIEFPFQDSLFVEYRVYNTNEFLRAGPTIRLASPLSPKAYLLDATPETPNHEPNDDLSGNLDSPLPPGRTFSYSKYGRTVHITNLEADSDTGKTKVMIVHGTPSGNSAPDGTIEFSVPTAAVGQKVYLVALASDVDGDTIAYNWQVPGAGALPNGFLVPVTFSSSGTKAIKCLLTDMHGGTRTISRNLSVVINHPPSISGLANKFTDEDTELTVDFSVSDPTTPAASIAVTAVSEDQSLVQNSGISVSPLGGGNRRLVITPRPNQHGTVTISVTASDGLLTHVEKFDVTIRPVTPGIVLVPRGSTWRYWDAGRDPAGTAGAWKMSAYDDSSWKQDNARFVFGEFLVPVGSTVLSNVPGRITCYFRKAFNLLTRPAGTPTLKLLCDDAAVVYLNGREIWRQNLPSGPITGTTRALTSIEGRDEGTFHLIPLDDAIVQVGANVLAVEVHDRGSSLRGGGDVSFDAEFALMRAPSLVTFTDRTTPEDTPLSFSFTNPTEDESPSGGVDLSARSSNPALVLDSDITFGFNVLTIPFRRTITITPRPNATGQTEITVIASDGSSETWRTFLLTVTPVNDAPSLGAIPDTTAALGEVPPAVPVLVGDIDSPVESLVVSATSSNPAFLPNSGIAVFAGDQPNRRWITLTPTPGIAAQSTVRVVVSDGQLTATNHFIFRVTLPLSVTNVPARLVQSGDVWRYWTQALPLDPRGNPVDWTDPGLDDRAWPSGRSRLGYGNSNLVTVLPAPGQVTTYFRRSFTITDRALFSRLNFRLLRDDGAVVHLNGQQIHLSNMPRTVTPTTLASSAVDGANEETWDTFSLTDLSSLQTGRNVLAVEVHQAVAPSTFLRGDVAFDLELEAVVVPPLASDALIAPGSVWRYLDQSAYPDETWRQAQFDDSGWAEGLARLGYGIGGESTVINGGPTNARNPSVLFRKVFPVSDPALYSSLHLFLQRDDGVAVFLNGTRVLTDNVSSAATLAELAYNEAGAGDQLTWRHFVLDPKKLLPGGNLLAVELHQASVTGPDVTFDAQLIGVVAGNPQLSIRPIADGVEVGWPAAFNGWTLESSPALSPAAWQPVAAPQWLDGAWLYVRPPANADALMFRLRK